MSITRYVVRPMDGSSITMYEVVDTILRSRIGPSWFTENGAKKECEKLNRSVQ